MGDIAIGVAVLVGIAILIQGGPYHMIASSGGCACIYHFKLTLTSLFAFIWIVAFLEKYL